MKGCTMLTDASVKVVLFASLLTTTTGAAYAGTSVTGAEGTAITPLVIPFQIDETGLPTFHAMVNGKPRVLFLDLGGKMPLALKSSAAEDSDVAYTGATQHFVSSNGTSSDVKSFKARDFEAGTVRLESIDGSTLPDSLYSFPQDGYLGSGFLRRFLVVFDYRHGEARLYSSNNLEVMHRECGTHVFPMSFSRGFAEITVETELGRRSFLLDTGSNQNVARPGTNPILGAAGTGFTYQKFEVGAQDLGPASFLVMPYAAPDVDGVLGRVFFSKHIVCIDASADRAAVG